MSQALPTDQSDRLRRPNGFSDLPCELRLYIFEIVARNEYQQPRVVEIYRKGYQLYSKTAPPALLHICHESRTAILKLYKPWLPQFKGTAVYKPWVHATRQRGIKNQFDLNNVCVGLEHDILLIRDPHTVWRLSSLECHHLRNLKLNIAGYLRPSVLRQKVRFFNRLEYLYIFDDTNDQAETWKANCIQLQLEDEEGKDKEESRRHIPNYIAPKVIIESFAPLPTPWGIGRPWTSYRHSKEGELSEPSLPRDLEGNPPKSPEMVKTKKRQRLAEGVEEERPRKRAQPAPKSVPKPAVTTVSRVRNQPYRKPLKAKSQPTPIIEPEPEQTSAPSSPSVTTDDEIQIQLQLREVDHDADEDTNAKKEPSTSNEAKPTLNATDSTDSDSSEGVVYVVEKFLAERQTPQGLEILVQWEEYPNEEDFTWEDAKPLAESVPDMLEEWNDRENAESKEAEDDSCRIEEVEEILGRRKFKGVPHYLVKWVGYEDVKDRTWEPCERLRIDTPFIVEEYEEKQKRAKKT